MRSGAYSGNNYGDATRLEAVKSGGDFDRRSYLKLDLTSIDADIYSAKLYLFGAVTAAAGGTTELPSGQTNELIEEKWRRSW